jgi:hypothetical protein
MIGDVTIKRGATSDPENKPVAVKNPRLVQYRAGGVAGAISAEFAYVDAVNKPEFIYTIMSSWFTPTPDFIAQYKEHLSAKNF